MDRPSKREEVYKAIDGEREYQDRGMGNAAHPPEGRHGAPDVLTPGEIILAMEENLKKAREIWYGPNGSFNCLTYMRKISALGVQCMENHGIIKR